jgi:F-box interacting protein
MAEGACAAEPAPLPHGIPDEIMVWEILVRLAPKDLLRCRAVCPAWRRATSTRRFLLAHHSRQPTLPLLCGYKDIADFEGMAVDIIPLEHQTVLASDGQLQSVARFGPLYWSFRVEASCDGLLVLTINCMSLCICNPATRQYAPLRLRYGTRLVGMYLHPPTGEYRLLLSSRHLDSQDGYHIFALGSGQPPRHIGIGCPHSQGLEEDTESVMLCGSLHWSTGQMIMVFDTTTESFRQMRSPIVSGNADLFEMDGMLAVYRCNDAATEIDIWVLEDCKGEAWAFKNRVELPVAQLTVQFGEFRGRSDVVVLSWDGDVLVLAGFGDWLIQVDINGKMVASFHIKVLSILLNFSSNKLLFRIPSFRH